MNTGAFGERFPYTNFHDMNLDWMIKIAKDFLDQYTHIQDVIAQGISDIGDKTDEGIGLLQEKYETLEGLLQEWYNEHSEDIADALADALEDLNDWLTEHEDFLNDILLEKIADFNESADAKTAECLASIPQDYSSLSADVLHIMQNFPEIMGVLDKEYTTSFSSSSQTVTTEYYLVKDVQYKVECDDTFTGYLNFYVTGDTSNVARLESGKFAFFTPSVSGMAKIFNGNSNKTGTTKLTITPCITYSSLTRWPELITTNARLDTLTGGTRSVNDFPVNKIVSIGATTLNLTDFPNIATTTGYGIYITFDGRGSGSGANGQGQLFIGTSGFACRWKADNIWYPWRNNDLNWKQYNTSALFTADYPSNLLADILPNKLICIGSISADPLDSPPNFVGNVITLSARSGGIFPGATQLAFNMDSLDIYRRTLMYDANGNYWTPWYSSVENGSVFYVGADREYTSLTSLWLDLKGTRYNKTVYIDAGTYDIFSEYLAEVAEGRIEIPPDNVQSGDFFEPYNAFVPHNTKIIGLGEVILQMTPSANEVTLGESRTWSPLNIYGSVDMENITVIAKNCRYALHNDNHNRIAGTKQHYKHCKFMYELSDLYSEQVGKYGFNIVIGFGMQQGGIHIFEDCEMYMDTPNESHSVYYGHETDEVTEGTIILKNCIIHSNNFNNNRTIRFQSLGTTQSKIKVQIENCYINGTIRYQLYYTNSKQNFEVTLLNCNKTEVARENSAGGSVVDIYTTTWYNPLEKATASNPLIYTNNI